MKRKHHRLFRRPAGARTRLVSGATQRFLNFKGQGGHALICGMRIDVIGRFRKNLRGPRCPKWVTDRI